MISLSYVFTDDVERVWADIAPILKKAVRLTDDQTMDTLLSSLLLEKMQLWIGHEGDVIVYAGVTQILNSQSGKKTAQIMYLSGSRLSEWSERHRKVIEAWAKNIGCDRVEIVGRRGWEKVCKDYRLKYVTLTRDL